VKDQKKTFSRILRGSRAVSLSVVVRVLETEIDDPIFWQSLVIETGSQPAQLKGLEVALDV